MLLLHRLFRTAAAFSPSQSVHGVGKSWDPLPVVAHPATNDLCIGKRRHLKFGHAREQNNSVVCHDLKLSLAQERHHSPRWPNGGFSQQLELAPFPTKPWRVGVVRKCGTSA